MKTISKSAPRMDHEPVLFEFVLLNAFSMLSVIAAIEPLRVANRMADHEHYAWIVVSEDGKPVRASNGFVVESQGRVGEGRNPKYCFVCAGLGLDAAHPARLSAFINRRHKAGVIMGSISMGTIFLARAGLLHQARCTIHWEGQPAFAEEFPGIALTRAIYEIDRNIMTCAGGMSSFDLMMHIISRDHDPRLVALIANQLQRDRVRSNAFLQPSGSGHVPETAPKQIHQAVALLSGNMEHPIAPHDLAAAVGSSRRTLERSFLKHVGMTPAKFCKTRRLERARDLLLHSNMPILDIALATGFRSGSYFCRCFTECFGIAPSSLRRNAAGHAGQSVSDAFLDRRL